MVRSQGILAECLTQQRGKTTTSMWKIVLVIFFYIMNPKESFHYNACTTAASQWDAFVSLLCFYSVFTQWPLKTSEDLQSFQRHIVVIILCLFDIKKRSCFPGPYLLEGQMGPLEMLTPLETFRTPFECCGLYWAESLRVGKKTTIGWLLVEFHLILQWLCSLCYHQWRKTCGL